MYRNKVNKITNKNMKKDTIKLNEQQLRQIVAECVKKVLKEFDNNYITKSGYLKPYPSDYADRWLSYAKQYAIKWQQKHPEWSLEEIINKCKEYIEGIRGNEEGYAMLPSPKLDAHDFFFGIDDAIGQVMGLV